MKNADPIKKYQGNHLELEFLNKSVAGVIIVQGLPLRIVFANMSLCKMLGYTKLELLKMSPSLIAKKIHSDDRKNFFKRYLKRLAGMNLKTIYEFRLVNRKGQIINILYQAKRIAWNGKPAIQATLSDITNQKRTEEKLAESLNWLRLLYNTGDDALLTLAPPTWKFTAANEQVKKLFRTKSVEEFLSYAPWQVSPSKQPDGQASKTKAQKMIQIALEKGQNTFEWTHKKVDGTTFPARVSLSSLKYKNKIFLQGRVTDLTLEKKQEAELLKYHTAIESSLVEIAFADINGKITYYNNTWAKNHGINKSEALGKNLTFFHPKSELAKVRTANKILERDKKFVGEINHKRKDGSIYPALMKNTLVLIENKPACLVATAQDMTKELETTNQLNKAKKWAEKIIEESPNIVLGLDSNFRVILCNKCLEEILNKNKNQILGKTWPELALPVSIHTKIWQIWEQIIKKKYADHHYINPLVDGQGKLREISWHNQVIEENGNFKMVLSTGIDVTTEQKNTRLLYQNQEKLKSLFASLPDIVFEINDKGFFVFYHAPKNGKLYATPEQFMNKHYSQVVPPDIAKLIDLAIKKNQNSQDAEFEYSLPLEGKILWFSASMSPIIIDGKYNGSVAVIRETTQEKEVDRLKTEFVSLASHQLRTPITSINWNCELLLESKKDPLTASQRELIEEINRSNQRNIQLVNALLNVARLEMGTVMIAPQILQPKDIYPAIIKQYQVQLEKKNLKVVEICDPRIKTIKADPKLLGIIFENLFSNAVKYSDPNTTIKITTRKKDKEMLICISNKGISIPEEQKSKMFTKLFRTDQAQLKDPDGSGLGLYIIKLILEKAGGKIWFTSTPKGQATFYVSLPLSGMKAQKGPKPLV